MGRALPVLWIGKASAVELVGTVLDLSDLVGAARRRSGAGNHGGAVQESVELAGGSGARLGWEVLRWHGGAGQCAGEAAVELGSAAARACGLG